jgi:arsenite-transporting ATPase
MRLILFMGKGGVGKTTIAAATALRCAELGYRTLVVSTDIAHSLSDVLDHPLSADPVSLNANLWAQEINVLDEVRSYWDLLRDSIALMLQGQGVNPMIAEELAIVPGMEEIASLLRIRKLSITGNFDVIVVDAAPTGETVRLLTVPESFTWYAGRLAQWNRSNLGLARTLGGPTITKVLDLLTTFEGEVAELRQMLIDPRISSYRVVFNPEVMVIKETQRALTYMNLFGYPVDAGIINRVLPETRDSSDPFLKGLRDLQQQALKTVYDTFMPLPLFEVSWYGEQMLGSSALKKLASSLWKDRDPTEVFWVGPIQQIDKRDNEYVLRLPLPHIEMDQVKLTKRGDELLISIGNFRREISLPHALAVLEASKAELTDDGSLEIHFLITDA